MENKAKRRVKPTCPHCGAPWDRVVAVAAVTHIDSGDVVITYQPPESEEDR